VEEKLKKIDATKAIGMGLLLALIYYFALYNDGSVLEMSISNARATATQKKTEFETMKKTLVDASRHKEISARLGEELKMVLQAVPESYSPVELMKLVSSEAKGAGLNILSISGAEIKLKDTKSNFIPINVTVGLSGTFNQIMIFLSNLTKVGKVIITKNISMGSSAGATANLNNVSDVSPILSFNGVFEAYRYQAVAPGKGGR
jgi:Tfp pilus assembly protein PilO